jgi:hypothetical protein
MPRPMRTKPVTAAQVRAYAGKGSHDGGPRSGGKAQQHKGRSGPTER